MQHASGPKVTGSIVDFNVAILPKLRCATGNGSSVGVIRYLYLPFTLRSWPRNLVEFSKRQCVVPKGSGVVGHLGSLLYGAAL